MASPVAAPDLSAGGGSAALAALRRTAYLMERANEPGRRASAFRKAVAVLSALDPTELQRRITTRTLEDLAGIGERTSGVAYEGAAGEVSPYLAQLEGSAPVLAEAGADLRGALRGDLHSHSDWSDGGTPIPEMALAAAALGHDYLVLTDHSPRLTVANGLSADRLREQLRVVEQLNVVLAARDTGLRILTGIEVDILDDGSLDQDASLLEELDLVVASVHSKLSMPASAMTRRMAAAVSNPLVDVLGHCTGRLLGGRQADSPGASRGSKARPESQFDAETVFAACAGHGTAVEINSRPERLDPPSRLLPVAMAAGCVFSIDTDAHAPGQLEWQVHGTARAEAAGIPTERIINTWSADALLAWTVRPTL